VCVRVRVTSSIVQPVISKHYHLCPAGSSPLYPLLCGSSAHILYLCIPRRVITVNLLVSSHSHRTTEGTRTSRGGARTKECTALQCVTNLIKILKKNLLLAGGLGVGRLGSVRRAGGRGWPRMGSGLGLCAFVFFVVCSFWISASVHAFGGGGGAALKQNPSEAKIKPKTKLSA